MQLASGHVVIGASYWMLAFCTEDSQAVAIPLQEAGYMLEHSLHVIHHRRRYELPNFS